MQNIKRKTKNVYAIVETVLSWHGERTVATIYDFKNGRVHTDKTSRELNLKDKNKFIRVASLSHNIGKI
jgi:hypothetical protein